MDSVADSLRRENEILRERIEQLEAVLVPHTEVPFELGLTGAEARVFAHLVSRTVGTKESILMALYSDKLGETPEIKIVDVFVCKIRKKIAAHGWCIETVWGQGYRLLSSPEVAE